MKSSDSTTVLNSSGRGQSRSSAALGILAIRPGEENKNLQPTLDFLLFFLLMWSNSAAALSWLSAPTWENLAWHLLHLGAT